MIALLFGLLDSSFIHQIHLPDLPAAYVHSRSCCWTSICATLAGFNVQLVFVLQATKPFIDPVTHKKIVFIDNHDTTSMPKHFHMESIEQCMGGNLSSEQAFNLHHSRSEMEIEDAQRHAAVGAMW